MGSGLIFKTRWLRVHAFASVLAAFAAAADTELRTFNVRLPHQEHNAIATSWPGIACWFWRAEEFQPGGYKAFLDLHAKHTGAEILTTSIRYPVEVTDPAVRDQIRDATVYARRIGLGLAVDLDVRLARGAFMAKHPGEMQELASLREFPVSEAGDLELTIDAPYFGDHYTFRAPAYHSLGSRFLRAYAYAASEAGIDPETVQDISDRCLVVETSPQKVRVIVRCAPEDAGRTIGLIGAFTLFTPDVFAPHLLEFERAILEQYADIPLAGACKDEWGFPGRFRPSLNDFWYSGAMAKRYAAEFGADDFVHDLFLMWKHQIGNEGPRIQAINRYMDLCRRRNAEVESHFYEAVKAVFGNDAFVSTHPTWFPIPGDSELIKNGLHWWAAPRDLAQTDESTPFAVRTALAKKWRAPLWYNMYYDKSVEAYEEDLWRHALGGGRMNFHPMYPRPDASLTTGLLSTHIFEAEARVRLLNYISTAPVDCPVAVIFGYPAAANWAGEHFGDVGLEVTDALWTQGFYADLIPTYEMDALHLDHEGYLVYGPQRYSAAILYHPEFGKAETATFVRRAASGGKTALYRIGDWTRDYEGHAVDETDAWPATMTAGDTAHVVDAAIAHLVDSGIEPQTRGTSRGSSGFAGTAAPEPEGHCRLLDGTVIFASGRTDVMGDPLHIDTKVQGHAVRADAVGVFGIRFGLDGEVEALAAGGLRKVQAGSLAIDLDERVDIALWRDASGQWQGVAHGLDALPEPLRRITAVWTRVRQPKPMPQE